MDALFAVTVNTPVGLATTRLNTSDRGRIRAWQVKAEPASRWICA